MEQVDFKNANSVYVFKDNQLIGRLARTAHQAEFIYDQDYLRKTENRNEKDRSLAFTIKASQTNHLTRGYNLSPFFAGLLPEGLRMQALIRTTKTSPDDLFSLLIASGTNLIGDISVALNPDFQQEALPKTKKKLSETIFWELFSNSINATSYQQRKLDSSIPGIQPKISANLVSFPVSVSSRKKEYILKLGSNDFPYILENEHFFMQMAKACGIKVANTKLVTDKEGNRGLLVERFDRIYRNDQKRIERIHQEDACQFLNLYPQDKYRVNFRDIATGLVEFSTAPILEIAKLLQIKAFSYLIANGDLHAKNISLQVGSSNSKVLLTPAYDLLSTLPYGDAQMALAFEGKTDNLKARYFIEFGEAFNVKQAAIVSMLSELVKQVRPWIDRIEEIGLPQKQTVHLKRLVEKRIKDITP
ncbi:MAG: type II toxin-antitoxin system HipA family toxin [Deltaproteobacteria bacterium]|nr:type II toxin-antitoxin system HipA family toxin [Deltaproteobacteria bacterium]